MIAEPPAPAMSAYELEAERVHAYARDVVEGRTVTNRYVRLAAARHLAWLEREDVRFDAERAGRAIAFFAHLRLAEGEFDGKPFNLSPWQAFIVGSLFGWHVQDDDGTWIRTFRNAYVETAKGSGKSPLAGGIGIYGLIADTEAHPEVYSAAVTRDQASILWTDAKNMIDKSPALKKRATTMVNSIVAARGGWFKPVSSEAGNLHGKRPHVTLIDEEHAHPSSDVIDAMRLGTKSRRNALIFRITNSGYDRQSVCWADHQYSVNVLEGVLTDDSWFAFVCGLDMCDEHRAGGMPVDGCAGCDQWTDEAVWEKANPNLPFGVPTRRYLRETVTEAQGKPSQQSVTKRLNFCIWTEGSGKWLDVTRFIEGSDERRLEAADLQVLDEDGDVVGIRRGFAGADVSSTTDLSAFALALPREACETEGHAGRCYDLLARFWLPEENMPARVKRDHVPFDVWARDGWITLTEGNRIDQEAIARDVVAFGASIEALGIDRWNTGWLTPKLQAEGIEVIEVGQGFASLSGPAKQLESDIAQGLVHHEGNPVLAWMVANAAAEEDASGNVKPSKAKSTDRIDGVAAWCDALFAAAEAPAPEEDAEILVDWG